VLKNNLLASVVCPVLPLNNRMEPLTIDMVEMKFRKIDKDAKMLIVNHLNGDIYVHGSDRMLKKYDPPAENLENIDWKKTPIAPLEEIPSHSIDTTCFDISAQFKFLATGGKDGNVFLRHVTNFRQAPNPIKAHSVFTGGVTALCLSEASPTLASQSFPR
jgi:WD40 repeat protein